MTTTKVRIEKETAKYYLNLETAFGKLCEQVGIDLDAYLADFSTMTVAFDISKRYGFRCDLHDAWEAVVAKKEFRPTSRRSIGSSRSPKRIQNSTEIPPAF